MRHNRNLNTINRTKQSQQHTRLTFFWFCFCISNWWCFSTIFFLHFEKQNSSTFFRFIFKNSFEHISLVVICIVRIKIFTIFLCLWLRVWTSTQKVFLTFFYFPCILTVVKFRFFFLQLYETGVENDAYKKDSKMKSKRNWFYGHANRFRLRSLFCGWSSILVSQA